MDPKLAFESTMMFLAKALHSILNRLAAKRKWPYWTLIKSRKGIRRKKQDEKIVSRNETYLVGTVLNSELDESLFALIIVEETGPKDSTLDFIHFTLLQTDDLNGNNW